MIAFGSPILHKKPLANSLYVSPINSLTEGYILLRPHSSKEKIHKQIINSFVNVTMFEEFKKFKKCCKDVKMEIVLLMKDLCMKIKTDRYFQNGKEN